MFKDTSELAENKLLLLYILHKLPTPTSNSQITQVVLENNLINYFSLQQYISELIDNGFISDFKENKSHKLTLSDVGKNTLEFFINRIPADKLKIIDSYMELSHNNEKSLHTFSASFDKSEDSSLVTLDIIENNFSIVTFKLPVENEEDAYTICDNWKSNGITLYEDILKILKNK